MEQLKKVGKWLSGKETHRENEIGKNQKYKGRRGKGPQNF